MFLSEVSLRKLYIFCKSFLSINSCGNSEKYMNNQKFLYLKSELFIKLNTSSFDTNEKSFLIKLEG